MAMVCGKNAAEQALLKPQKSQPRGRGRGRPFEKGHPGGPGNPHAGLVTKLRSALLAAVTEDDIRDVIRAMVVQAKQGDTAAAKLVFDRCLGQAPLEEGDRGDILAATSAGLAALLIGAGQRSNS